MCYCCQEPFTHESLLLDQQDQKLTKREKRLAQQGYENDKKMSLRPSYYPRPFTTATGVDMARMPVNIRSASSSSSSWFVPAMEPGLT